MYKKCLNMFILCLNNVNMCLLFNEMERLIMGKFIVLIEFDYV